MANANLFNLAFYLVVAWMLGIVVVFAILLKKYTFGKWNPENPNPYVTETFGLPRGVFRGFLTLSLLFIVLLLEILNLQFPLIEQGKLLLTDCEDCQTLFIPEERYKELMVAFQMMLAFYFGSKVMHHVTKADQRKSDKIAETVALAQTGPKSGSAAADFEEEGAQG